MSQSEFFRTDSRGNEHVAAPRHSPTEEDRSRFSSQARALLSRLELGSATNSELSAICLRFGARLFELRNAGYQIETKSVGRGLFTYSLAK